MHFPRWRSSFLASLALLAACGPSNSGAEEGTGGTEASDSEPTAASDPTVPTEASDSTTPTGGPSAEDCGSCGTLLEGDLSPSGNPQVDGLVVATDQLRSAVRVVQGDFDADIRALADIYGLAPAEVSPAYVGQLVTAIKADLASNTDGIRVVHVPAACRANIEVALQAQRACETQAGCSVPVLAVRPAVLCDGTCFGGCEGSCAGPLSCVLPAPAIECEGECDGACTFVAPEACDGICRGDCFGACDTIDANGQCAGGCDGACDGSCDAVGPVVCPGACSGACLLEQGDAQCGGLAMCRGECNAGCAGECAGTVTPPSAGPDCSVSAGCQRMAAAQGSASLWCAPPIVELHFTKPFGVPDGVWGGFLYRTTTLERRATAILQGAAQLDLLITGKSGGQVLFNPAPLSVVTTVLQQIVGSIDTLSIPEGRRACVEPAVQAAVGALADSALSAANTIEAQTQFAALFNN